MKNRTILNFTLILTLLFFSLSCKKDNEKINFSNDEIVDIIKMNFLANLGGIELERSLLHQKVVSDKENCDVDTIYKEENIDGSYDLVMKGKYQKECSVFEDGSYNEITKYFDRGSKGESSLGKYKFSFDMQSTFTFATNFSDNLYMYHGGTHRNLEFLKGLNELQKFGGNISFLSNSCQFHDFGMEFSEKIEYKVNLNFFNKVIFDDDKKIEALIKRVKDNWVLVLDENEFILE